MVLGSCGKTAPGRQMSSSSRIEMIANGVKYSDLKTLGLREDSGYPRLDALPF